MFTFCVSGLNFSQTSVSLVLLTNPKGSGEPQDTGFKIIINVSNPKIARGRIANILLLYANITVTVTTIAVCIE